MMGDWSGERNTERVSEAGAWDGTVLGNEGQAENVLCVNLEKTRADDAGPGQATASRCGFATAMQIVVSTRRSVLENDERRRL